MAACHQLVMPCRRRKHLFSGNHPQNPVPTAKDRTPPKTWTGCWNQAHNQGKDMTALDTGTCPFLAICRSRGQSLLDWQISASGVKQSHLCLTFALVPAEAVSFTKGWGNLKPHGCWTRGHIIHVVTAVQASAHTNARAGRQPTWKRPEGPSTCLAHHDPSLACCPEPEATDQLPTAPSVSIP